MRERDRLSRMGGSTKACVFCGKVGVKLTKEHVYPRWLSRLIESRAIGPIVYSTTSRKAIRTTKGFDLTLRDVCESCNSGWLHDLERSFRAVMSDPILGDEQIRAFPQSVQLVIATWAVKTWLLAEHGWSSMRKQGIDMQPDVLRYMRENNQPPQTAVVWLGRFDPGPEGAVGTIRTQDVLDPTSGEAWGVFGIFTIGWVLLIIYMPTSPPDAPPPDEVFGIRISGMQLFLDQIWPHEVEEVRWPPMGVLSNDSLEALWPPLGHVHPGPMPPFPA